MKLSSRQEPMKAPSELLGMDVNPQGAWSGLMSIKYNGVRGTSLHYDRSVGPMWCSTRMEPHNFAPHITEMFRDILEYSVKHEVVFDGEFESSSLNKVGKTISVLKGTAPVPDDLCFRCFYAIPYSIWNMVSPLPMGEMIAEPIKGLRHYFAVEQKPVRSFAEFIDVAESSKHLNLEGYMYLNPNAYYKHGRATTRENILMKYKYYTDPIDAEIVYIEPMKRMVEGLSRSRNAIGGLKKIHTKDAYTTSNIGGTIHAKMKDGVFVKLPFPKGKSFAERAMYLAEFGSGRVNDLKGTGIQFKKLSCENGVGAIAVKEVEFRD